MAIRQVKIYIQGEPLFLRLDQRNVRYIANAYPSQNGSTSQAFNAYLQQFKSDKLPVSLDWLRLVFKDQLTSVTGYKCLSTALNHVITAERISKEGGA